MLNFCLRFATRVRFLWLFIITFACSEQKVDMLLIDRFSLPTMQLTGKPILEGVAEVRDIVHGDSLVLVQARWGTDVLMLFDAAKWRELSRYNYHAAGHIDLLSPAVASPLLQDNHQLKFYCVDTELKKISKISINAEKAFNYAETVSPLKISPTIENLVYLNDSIYVGIDDRYAHHFVTYDVGSRQVRLGEENTRDLSFLHIDSRRAVQRTHLAVQPLGERFMLAYHYLPYLQFYNSDLEKIRSVELANFAFSEELAEELVANGDVMNIIEDVCTTEKYIYLLMCRQADKYVGLVPAKVEVLVLDWRGHPEHVLQLDQYVLQISVSGDDREMVGIDPIEDKVYRFRL